jgi:hypothetical protein
VTDRPTIRLVVCVAASVLLHLTVLWPAMGRALAASPPGADDPPPPTPDMVPPPVEPGIERSDASTLTWVGYEEYREHLARLAAVDQAAFTTAPGGAAADADAAGEGGTPEAGALADAAATDVLAPEAARGVDAPDLRGPGDATEVPPATTPSTAPADAPPVRDAAADLATVNDLMASLREAVAVLDSMAPIGGQGGEAERTVVGRGADAADGESVPREGEIADLESPATSRIDVRRADLRPDRPIAREGLQVKPREPDFTTYERVTASPRNPVARITFGRDGVPVEAILIEGSGDGRIDSAVTASLFRWRAAGARLAELPADGTIVMEFRIVLNGR